MKRNSHQPAKAEFLKYSVHPEPCFAIPPSPGRVKHQTLSWRIEAGAKKLTWQILFSVFAVVVATNHQVSIWLDKTILIGKFSAIADLCYMFSLGLQ